MVERRVLVVSHEASLTGAPKVAIEILRALGDAGMHTTLVNRWGGPLEPELRKQARSSRREPLSHLRVALRRFRTTRPLACKIELAAARKVLKATHPQLVWANTALSACYVQPALDLGIPVVLHLHELGQLLTSTLDRHSIQWSDPRLTLVACSEPVAAAAAQHCGVDRADIHVVLSRPNLVALPAHRDSVRLTGGVNVLACGTADHRKGTDTFVEAAGIVQQRSPELDVAFTWVGSTKSFPDATRGHLVRFVGEQTDAQAWIAAADIVVIPSRQDPFPLVTIEAMALGKPVVGTRVGGIPDQLGAAGVLVEPADPNALADAIDELCRDTGRRTALGAAARDRAESLFDASIMRDEIARLASNLERRRG